VAKNCLQYIALGAASFVLMSLPVLARDGEKAQLAGRWKFNSQVSDHAAQKLRDAQQHNRRGLDRHEQTYPGAPPSVTTGYPAVGVDMPAPGGGVSVGDPEGIGRGGQGSRVGDTTRPAIFIPGGTSSDPGTRGNRGGPGHPADRSPGATDPRWNWLTRNPAFLQIEQGAKQVVITDDAGNVQTYYADGKKHEEKDASGNKISTKARWEGNSLVTETRLSPSEILTKSFRLSEEHNQIYVKARFESPSLAAPVKIRRVYDLEK
jgi:hypothetical protein